MRPHVDLHTHSTFSDGTYTTTEICMLAERSGVRTIALSDHDTTAGLTPMRKALEEANRSELHIGFIPAIEVSSGDNGLMHVLGYGIKEGREPLQRELVTLKRKRAERNLETIRLLNRLLDTELIPEPSEQSEQADTVLGRMHVARVLIEKQVVRSIDEAFHKYLGVGKAAYLPLRHISAEEAIDILCKSQTVPVLAHPMRITQDRTKLETLIAHLKENGLMGMEVFHPSASHADVKWLYRIAHHYDLLITGGSDFHGNWGMHSKLGKYPSGWHTWEQDLDSLLTAIKLSSISKQKETVDV